jgi:hypothetical protein
MPDVLVAKPGIAAVAVAQNPCGPASLRVSEGLIAILRAGGRSDKVVGFADRFPNILSLVDAMTAGDREERFRLRSGHPRRRAGRVRPSEARTEPWPM